MRLAAAIAFLVALGLMAVAAYDSGPSVWKAALYIDVIAWTEFLLLLTSAVLETKFPAPAWVRAGLAAAAAIGALGASFRGTPGKLPEQPFTNLAASGVSLSALGMAAAALVLGGLAIRFDKRGPSTVAGLAMLVALVALRDWLMHAT